MMKEIIFFSKQNQGSLFDHVDNVSLKIERQRFFTNDEMTFAETS